MLTTIGKGTDLQIDTDDHAPQAQEELTELNVRWEPRPPKRLEAPLPGCHFRETGPLVSGDPAQTAHCLQDSELRHTHGSQRFHSITSV